MDHRDARIQALLAAQERAGGGMRADPQWTHDGHNVGDDVIAAVESARRALAAAPVVGFSWLDDHALLVDAVVRAHAEFRRAERDPDGYGSATLHELRRGIAALRPSGPPTADELKRGELDRLAAAGDADAQLARAIDLLGESAARLGGPALTAELDPSRGQELLVAASQQGHDEAQFRLGCLLAAEANALPNTIWDNDERDTKLSEARTWFERAAAQGHAAARERLKGG
ncbi:MAG TPA: hypothetical protein VFF06_04595 [Polyangia bacterium]|nr:hypothetical protein [Polyangia bacterium]